MAALTHLQSSVDRMDAKNDQMHAETRAMIEGLNIRVIHMDERLTEYQQ